MTVLVGHGHDQRGWGRLYTPGVTIEGLGPIEDTVIAAVWCVSPRLVSAVVVLTDEAVMTAMDFLHTARQHNAELTVLSQDMAEMLAGLFGAAAILVTPRDVG
jgi:hypothetical protein